MKTALIIGIGGNFGSEMARALKQQGWTIKALLRNASKAPSDLSTEQLVLGDATNLADVRRAAEGIDLLVYAANPPYHRWQQDALAMLEPSLQVAQDQGLRLLFPGNVYNYSPSAQAIDEQVAQQPVTDKGRIRRQMEQRLLAASQQGARITLVRGGDFLGLAMQQSWLKMMLKAKGAGWHMAMPHDSEHVHFWSYLPDLCANAALLLKQSEQSGGRLDCWHDQGLALTTADWRQAFAVNGAEVKFGRFPWWLLRLIAPFYKLLHEVVKMRYLWQKPVLLDGTKLAQQLGEDLQKTPLAEILAAVMAEQRKLKG
ncbi:NAD(P)H-binding protein [Reinekea sp.]|uniref:NAD(P)H-binding protein n=1 Tax=Reinekea sp. TaxID=1970455 RepID=UPI002A7FB69A|nr:NAD(P)H-binding protein [Reinekea sp.]